MGGGVCTAIDSAKRAQINLFLIEFHDTTIPRTFPGIDRAPMEPYCASCEGPPALAAPPQIVPCLPHTSPISTKRGRREHSYVIPNGSVPC